jgi:transcriptional regulator with XRE-family HTH domain
MSEYPRTLREELDDEEYRYAYAEDYLNTHIAAQIRVLREQRGMTQQDLADKIGTKQAGVSRLENVNYSSWKTQTLKRIARALGVGLSISFETFGTLLEEAAGFGRGSLERPEFANDPAFATATLGCAVSLLEPSQSYWQSVTGAVDASQAQNTNIVQGPWPQYHGQIGSINPVMYG